MARYENPRSTRGVPSLPLPAVLAVAVALALLAAVGVLAPPPASAAVEGAAGSASGWGPRAGVSSSPGQFVIGLHYDMGEVAHELRLVPNADLGLGDHRTMFTANCDLAHSFPLERAGWLSVGGTVGVVWTKWDGSGSVVNGSGRRMKLDDSDTGLGVAGIIGFRPRWSGRPLFVDLKIRISDSYPGAKLTVGTSFRGPKDNGGSGTGQ